MTFRCSRSRSLSRRGVTLVELMVAMAVFSLLGLGVAAFTYDSTMIVQRSIEKLQINRDVRQFTAQVAADAQAANGFKIYRSFAKTDRDHPSDSLVSGLSGDFLLFTYHQPHPQYRDPDHYTKLVGYFRNAEEGNEGPVYRFEIEYDEASYKNVNDHTAESLLASLSVDGDHDRVVELSRGLADGTLFYNYAGLSIMIKAEIIHGHYRAQVTDTYNYTVSPRG